MTVRARLSPAIACLLMLLLFTGAPLGAAPPAESWSFWDVSDESSAAVVDHGPWQVFLNKYLSADEDGINRVAYGAVSNEDRAALNDYLQNLASRDPRQLRRAEQFAYWVNLYNGLTVEVVLRNAEKATIRRMGKRLFSIGPWDDALIAVAGQALSLNDIEHRILRPIWRERRIHYAVNCASLGCPSLADRAYAAANTERLLAAGEMDYINHPRGVSFDSRGRLTLSELYQWYRQDFASDEKALLDYLADHHQRLGPELRGYQGRIRYDYNWSLNRVE